MSFSKTKKVYFLSLLLAALGFSSTSHGMSIEVSGMFSENRFEYMKTKSEDLRAKVGFFSLYIFQFGYSYRIENKISSGYKEVTSNDQRTLVKSIERTSIYTHSFDTTMYLFPSQVVIPYVFGGVAFKKYNLYFLYDDQESGFSTPLPPGFEYGFGCAIRLSQKFMLKGMMGFTPSFYKDPQTDEYKRGKDTFTQVGLSFEI